MHRLQRLVVFDAPTDFKGGDRWEVKRRRLLCVDDDRLSVSSKKLLGSFYEGVAASAKQALKLFLLKRSMPY